MSAQPPKNTSGNPPKDSKMKEVGSRVPPDPKPKIHSGARIGAEPEDVRSEQQELAESLGLTTLKVETELELGSIESDFEKCKNDEERKKFLEDQYKQIKKIHFYEIKKSPNLSRDDKEKMRVLLNEIEELRTQYDTIEIKDKSKRENIGQENNQRKAQKAILKAIVEYKKALPEIIGPRKPNESAKPKEAARIAKQTTSKTPARIQAELEEFMAKVEAKLLPEYDKYQNDKDKKDEVKERQEKFIEIQFNQIIAAQQEEVQRSPTLNQSNKQELQNLVNQIESLKKQFNEVPKEKEMERAALQGDMLYKIIIPYKAKLEQLRDLGHLPIMPIKMKEGDFQRYKADLVKASQDGKLDSKLSKDRSRLSKSIDEIKPKLDQKFREFRELISNIRAELHLKGKKHEDANLLLEVLENLESRFKKLVPPSEEEIEQLKMGLKKKNSDEAVRGFVRVTEKLQVLLDDYNAFGKKFKEFAKLNAFALKVPPDPKSKASNARDEDDWGSDEEEEALSPITAPDFIREEGQQKLAHDLGFIALKAVAQLESISSDFDKCRNDAERRRFLGDQVKEIKSIYEDEIKHSPNISKVDKKNMKSYIKNMGKILEEYYSIEEKDIEKRTAKQREILAVVVIFKKAIPKLLGPKEPKEHSKFTEIDRFVGQATPKAAKQQAGQAESEEFANVEAELLPKYQGCQNEAERQRFLEEQFNQIREIQKKEVQKSPTLKQNNREMLQDLGDLIGKIKLFKKQFSKVPQEEGQVRSAVQTNMLYEIIIPYKANIAKARDLGHFPIAPVKQTWGEWFNNTWLANTALFRWVGFGKKSEASQTQNAQNSVQPHSASKTIETESQDLYTKSQQIYTTSKSRSRSGNEVAPATSTVNDVVGGSSQVTLHSMELEKSSAAKEAAKIPTAEASKAPAAEAAETAEATKIQEVAIKVPPPEVKPLPRDAPKLK